jgi:hypothetical protein
MENLKRWEIKGVMILRKGIDCFVVFALSRAGMQLRPMIDALLAITSVNNLYEKYSHRIFANCHQTISNL